LPISISRLIEVFAILQEKMFCFEKIRLMKINSGKLYPREKVYMFT